MRSCKLSQTQNVFRMSNWNSSDLEAEDYDPNKDYSVQVQRKDGGLASTQVRFSEIQSLKFFSVILFLKAFDDIPPSFVSTLL